MKTIIKTSIAGCAVLAFTCAPVAHAQFGLGKLVDSAKKELNKGSGSEASESADSGLDMDAYNKKYKNYEKTVVQGAGLGAIAGGIAGYALGGSEEAVAIGAGVGALAGGAFGKHVADQSNSITKNRKKLEKGLKKSAKFRESTLEMLEITKNKITELETSIKDLESAYYAGSISTDELKIKVAAIESASKDLNANLAKDQERLKLKSEVWQAAETKAIMAEDPEVKAMVSQVQTEKYAIGNVTTIASLQVNRMVLNDQKTVTLKRIAG